MVEYRKNDIVTVKATVVRVIAGDSPHLPGKVCVSPLGHYGDVYVDAEHVEILTPYFAKGEFVVDDAGGQGSVVSTFDDWVWVRSDDGELITYAAADLKHWTKEVADVDQS